MKKAKDNLIKYDIVKEIIDTLYKSGEYVDKKLVTSLISKDISHLNKILREVKISGILDESKKRD